MISTNGSVAFPVSVERVNVSVQHRDDLVALSRPDGNSSRTKAALSVERPDTSKQSSRSTLLTVDDDPASADLISAVMGRQMRCLSASSGEEAMRLLSTNRVDLVFCDIHLSFADSGEESGIDLAFRILASFPDVVVVVISGEVEIDYAISALRAGAFDYIRKPFEVPHFQAVVRRALNYGQLCLARRTYKEILEELVHARTAQLDALTRRDELTGLPNRQQCESRLAAMLRNPRTNGMLGVLAVSIDQFDAIVDSLGHAAGAKVLRQAAGWLTACARDNDTVARLEGNEFVVLLNSHGPSEEGAGDAEGQRGEVDKFVRRLRETTRRSVNISGREIFLTLSIGGAISPEDGADAESLLHHARIAMVSSRNGLEGGFCAWSPPMHANANRRLLIETELRRSAEAMDFEIYYQPILDMDSQRMVGAEALLRWPGAPEGVSQEEFIATAEASGLIVPIGDWVLRQACVRAVGWQTLGLGKIRIGVNISAAQFRQPSLLLSTVRALAEAGLDPALLELELTERSLVYDLVSSAGVLRELKEQGISITIDDFGTGYSSLGYLKSLPVDRLKIDRSFLLGIDAEADAAAVVTTIIDLAHKLRLQVVAEGIETEQQLRFLRIFRCDLWQGYLCSRPLPAEAFETLLEGEKSMAVGDFNGRQFE